MSDWYRVEFYGRPAEGGEPKVPANGVEVLALGRALAEAFGFEIIDRPFVEKMADRPLVQCKVTAAVVNYPCDAKCDPACAPGSTAQPTTDADWKPISLPTRSA